MRAVVQRCSRAEVRVSGRVLGKVGRGFVVLLGAGAGDTDDDLSYVVDKIATLRVFSDADGKMNLALPDVGGAVLLISQFTLYGDCRKGRRPSFVHALEPAAAKAFYLRCADALGLRGIPVELGEFGADMEVDLVNDGPVTLLIDSRKAF